MSDEPKFCKDCKHFKQYEFVHGPFGGQGGESNCEHPSLKNLVYGAQLSVDAMDRRHPHSLTGCRAEGLQFEAGEPTPGILQPSLDRYKKVLAEIEGRESQQADRSRMYNFWKASEAEHAALAPKRRWWEFWK